MANSDTRSSTSELSQATALRSMDLPALAADAVVSVLIPSYNYERFLPDAIDSVLAQTYERLEVVVCDDESTDGSPELVRRYAERDDRVRLVQQKNAGQSAALSRAFAESNGHIVCLLDPDDYYRQDKLQHVVDAFRREPTAGMVVHRIVRVDERGHEEGVHPRPGALPHGWIAEQTLRNGGVVPWIQNGMICLRREIAERIFPIDPLAETFADVVLRGAASLLAPVVALDEPLTYYRLHGSNHGNTASSLTVEQALQRRHRDLKSLKQVYGVLADWYDRQETPVALPPFETTRPYIERRYVIAHLSREPRGVREELRRELLAQPHALTPTLRALYRISNILPPRVFKPALDVVYGQGRLKNLFARTVAVARRTGRGSPA